MEGERLKSYRRWYKELDARKAEMEEEGVEDPRTLKLLEGELRCLEELITLDSELMLHLPDALGQGDAPDAESLVTRNVSTWPGDSGLPPVEGLDLSLVTDMLILSATSPWVVFVAERFKWNTVYVSPSAKRLLGWRQQELVGVPVSDRCHPDDVPTMLNMFNAGANSSGNSLYYRRMRRDRSYVAVQGTGRILGQRWFAWMELLVAEAEPAPPSAVGSPIKRASPTSPSTSARSRLIRAPAPPEMPSLPATAFFPGGGNSSFASFPGGGNSLASSRNLSSQSITELIAMPSVRHSLGGSPPAARQSSSGPPDEKKGMTHSLGGSYVDPQRASTGGLPVGPLEMVRRKGSRPTSPLSEQDSEQSFNSGRYNGQDSLGFSHSTGALGLSSAALIRTLRPSEGLRSETLVSMNSAERLRGLPHRSSLRGSGSSGTPSNSSPSLENGAPLLPSEVKLFPRQGAQNEPHMSPPSQPLSRSGSGSSGGGKSAPSTAPKVGLDFAYGALISEKEGDLMRTSLDHESVLDASGLVGTPLYKEPSNVDLDDQERWRPQNEESNSDIGLSNSILVPVSGGASPKLPPVSGKVAGEPISRYRNRPAPPPGRRAYGTPPTTPFAEVAPPVPRPPGGKPEGELDGIRGARVLLVEDDVTNRTVGQRLLESLHCEVTVTCNGKEALEAMRGNPEDPFSLSELGEDEELPPRFDLVLMDLLMPVMDGLRAVEKFRDEEQDQKPRRKRMLIFALTGNVSDGDMVKCAQSGFDEFVSKPLTVEKLLHRLYGVCKTTDRFPGLRTSNFALPS